MKHSETFNKRGYRESRQKYGYSNQILSQVTPSSFALYDWLLNMLARGPGRNELFNISTPSRSEVIYWYYLLCPSDPEVSLSRTKNIIDDDTIKALCSLPYISGAV